MAASLSLPPSLSSIPSLSPFFFPPRGPLRSSQSGGGGQTHGWHYLLGDLESHPSLAVRLRLSWESVKWGAFGLVLGSDCDRSQGGRSVGAHRVPGRSSSSSAPWARSGLQATRQHADHILTHQCHNKSNHPNPDPLESLFSIKTPK